MQGDDKEDSMKHQNSYKDIIEEKLEKARFRYNFFRCESTYLTVLTIGLAITLITLITRKFVDIPYYAYITLISLFTIYFFLTLATTINKWIGKAEAASILDKKMHFKERLVTGLEYAEQKEKNKFFDMLANDITSKLDDKGIKAALPHRFPKATKFFVPVSILLLILLLLPYIYPEKPEQIVTNDLTNNNLSKLSKPETKETEDKKDELKQEEKPKEPQEEQENKKLAGTETEESKKEQDKKKKDQQLQAQATKDKTNPLQDEISKLLSKINATLAKFEDDKPKPGEKAESEKSKLSDQKAPESQKKEEEPQQQTAKTETEPLESKKEKEPAKTADASDSDKKPPEQEQAQEQAKDQKKKKQPPKIPESKLLQKLAKLLFPPKDNDSSPMPSIPMGGSDKDQSDSSNDQSDQSKETEPSASSGSSGSSQQESSQEELSKGTSQPEKPEPAPSGSDGKTMPESQQEETNSGAEDKVTKNQEDSKTGQDQQGKQQEKTDSKSSDTEQTAKDSQGGQEESQTAGSTEVASGKDKESGTGMDGSKTDQGQKEKQPGSADKRSDKLSDKLDTQTASGEKKTGGQPTPSGSDGKTMPESQQQESMNADDQVTKKQENLKGESDKAPSQTPEGTDTPTKRQKGSGDNLKDKLAQADRKPGGTGSQTSHSPATREDTELPQEQQSEKTDSKSSDTKQTAKDSQGGQEESQTAGGAEVASGKDKESGTGMDGSKKTDQGQKEKQSGSADKRSDKLSDKPSDRLDTQTASGEKKTGDQPTPSGSGEKNIPETKQQESMKTGDQVTKKQEDLKGENDKAPSQTPEGADTQAKGQKDSGQDIKDKLAQGDMKAGEASSQPSPSSTSREDMKSPEGKQEKDASGSEKAGSELMSGAKETTPDSQGEQGKSQTAGGAKVASGKGTDAGTEPGGSKTGQQQGGQQETLKKGMQETEGGKESGESAASTGKLAKKQKQAGKNGNKGEGESATGTGSDRKSVESPGKHGGKEDESQTAKVAQLDKTAKSKTGDSKGNAQSSADLRNKIASQMESLSRQISNLEKKMGVDVSDNLEMEKGLDISELKHEGIDKAEQKDSNKLQRDISGIAAAPGSEPGKKLYSSEPEKIETPENAEKFKLQLKGTKDESGAKRETVSTGKGKATTKRKLPTVGYDSAARLSTQQAEDDTLKKTSIPLEYEEIIKQIHSEKE